MEQKSWDDAKLADWKIFWESETGQEYLAKLEDMKKEIFISIMNSADKEVLSNLAGRAAALELISQDIKQGVETANKRREEEEAKNK